MRYQIKHALVQYGADTILEDINFEVHDSEKIAVVGRNGCGKTTLLKLIAGDLQMNNLDSDEECGIFMAGQQSIGFLRQISFEDGTVSVEDEIRKTFAEVFATEERMAEVERLLADGENRRLLAEYDHLQKKMEALRGYSWKRDMEVMFQQFGFPLEDLKRPIGSFSGGQQTKVAFIKLLLSRPDIMLLDEPTNHLDLPTIEWLEDYLKKYDKAVVIVSHDRMFLDKVIDVTYEIEYHKMKRYPGNYTTFMRLKEEAYAKQEKDYELQQKEIQRLKEWIEQWKNTPTKVAAARSKMMALEHMELIEKPRRFDTRAFKSVFRPRIESYTEVIRTKNLEIGYDHVLSEVSLLLQKQERLAVVGENGKGKSTLLKTLIGELEPLGGTYRIGQNVEIGYFDQQRAVVNDADPEQTVLDNFWETYPDLLRVSVRNALGAFMFSGEEVEKKMGQLSGGEKVRLALCKMLFTKPNLLILDEPTNHMDIVGKEALEKMLVEYSGTVLFVSHDRYFIKQIATGVLEFGLDEVRQYQGTYDEYLEEKRKREAGIIKDSFRNPAGGKGLSGAGSKGAAGSGAGSHGTAAAGTGNGAGGGSTAGAGADGGQGKKNYFNPGKMKSKLQKQLEKCEHQLAVIEEKTEALQAQLSDPANAADYEKLMALQAELDGADAEQERLLELMIETEEQLAELEG